MNYNDYLKLFTAMQKDHYALTEMEASVKVAKMQQYLGSTNEKDGFIMEEYNKLKVKILASATRLKEFFVEHNEEFTYPIFKVSLEFFNTYAMQENLNIMKKSDYEKCNKAFLDEYKEGLLNTLNLKQMQYDKLTQELDKTEKLYEEKVGEPLKNSENKSSQANTLQAKYRKDYYQREMIFNKLHFIKKEVNLINHVLQNENEHAK
jgi:hypothetical protein